MYQNEIKRCLVTGGAGFIGSHLCDALISKGYSVICLDNLITGNLDNINHLKKNPLFKFINRDVSQSLENSLINELGNLDFIYHLASPASPMTYKKYSVETLLVNSVGTKNMLNLALEKKAAFLFSSTSEVYGNPREHPQKESYWGNVNPIGVRACYDEAKRFGEALIMEYFRKFKADVRIVRIFNTYGPRMHPSDGRVIVNLVNQSISGKNLTVHGNGRQTRSFCYVSDMVRGIILAMESEKTKGSVINLGYPKEHTINEIAQIIKKATNSASKIVYTEKSEDDPVRRKPDISKAKKLLDWEPHVSLNDGFKKTIEFFQK